MSLNNKKSSAVSSNTTSESSIAGSAAVTPIVPVAGTSGSGGIKPSASAIATKSNSKNDNLYCYCQCPYDEVSEMIACDGPNCKIEWFHFECVGIMIPPKGKWYCPSCRKGIV